MARGSSRVATRLLARLVLIALAIALSACGHASRRASAAHAPGTPPAGAVLRRACRVGAGAVLTPGVEIGEEAYVAAGAVVTRDVPRRAVVMGVPARVVREVGGEDLLERWRPTP